MEQNEVIALLEANLKPIWDEQLEQSARLSAMRLLLEDLFADKYSDKLPEFNARMERFLELTRTASVKGAPVSDEQMNEMQARVATHLERFRSEAARRIAARSSK